MRHGVTADVFRSSDVIDAHFHVWGTELLDVPWLNEADALWLRRVFTLDQAARMHQAEGISSAVAVTADESYEGTELLLARCSGRSDITAVVGGLDLLGPELPSALDALGARPGGRLLRGLRVVDIDRVISDPRALRRALGAIADRGLVLEVLAVEAALAHVLRLCDLTGDIRVVVDHLGNPSFAGDRGGWVESLRRLAEVDQVHLKVSGAVTYANDFASLLDDARDAFGAARLMAGTDWPVSARAEGAASSWQRIIDATSAWNPAEIDDLFGATAARVYGRAA
jgi:L-fuconolactonase